MASRSPERGPHTADGPLGPVKRNSLSPSARQRSPSPSNRETTILQNMARGIESKKPGSPSRRNQSTTPAAQHSHYRTDRVRKNAKGGVLITQEEISTVFQLLDADKSGTISMQNLKKRMSILFPGMTAKDFRFLMNNKKELTRHDLEELLLNNEITGFDPVIEAFRIFDPLVEGYVNGDKLRDAFSAFGMGDLADDELEVLVRTADIDGDGRINVEDFRQMLDAKTAAALTAPRKKAPSQSFDSFDGGDGLGSSKKESNA